MGELIPKPIPDRSERIERRNKDIVDLYFSYKDKRQHGRQMYSNEYIIAKVAYKFYLSPSTVEDIIFKNK